MSLSSTVTAPAPVKAGAAYLPALTGVRALAAFLVCLHHFNPFQPGAGLPGLLHDAVLEFHVGVPLFFVLSGFLITLRYAGTEQWTGAWWRRYLRNRVARIYPLYFLLTTLTIGLFWVRHADTAPPVLNWLLNISFLRGFFDDYKYSGIAQGWTLTVEECFYLFAPLAFLWLRRRPRQLWLQPVALLALGAALVLTLGQLEYRGLFGNFRFMLLFTFFGRAVEFYAGVQLALWYRQGRLRAPRWAGLYTWAGLLAIGAVVLALVAVRGDYAYGQEAPLGIVLNNAVLPAGIGLFYAGLLTEATWLRRVLSTPLLQLLGKSSYAFYLIHVAVAPVVYEHVVRNVPLALALTAVVAIGLYYLVEQPLNRWLRQT